jgi:hypothetical protein
MAESAQKKWSVPPSGRLISIRWNGSKNYKAAFTIPRMELLAAEMGLALAKKLIVTIDVRHQDIYIWTDSRAVHD